MGYQPNYSDLVLGALVAEYVWYVLGAFFVLGIVAQPEPAKKSDDGWGNW